MLLFGIDQRFGGNKSYEMNRERPDFDTDIASCYSDWQFRRVYRMSKDEFNQLHADLDTELSRVFFPRRGGKQNLSKSKYLIDSKIRLSVAIRFFAGADPLDLFAWHGISLVSVYVSIWGVIDAINAFQMMHIRFPDHKEQEEIAQGFYEKSKAGFSCVIGAIDELLIWIRMPSLSICRFVNCGQSSFLCSRKAKFGLNMQAICDHKLRFRWVEIGLVRVAITWHGLLRLFITT